MTEEGINTTTAVVAAADPTSNTDATNNASDTNPEAVAVAVAAAAAATTTTTTTAPVQDTSQSGESQMHEIDALQSKQQSKQQQQQQQQALQDSINQQSDNILDNYSSSSLDISPLKPSSVNDESRQALIQSTSKNLANLPSPPPTPQQKEQDEHGHGNGNLNENESTNEMNLENNTMDIDELNDVNVNNNEPSSNPNNDNNDNNTSNNQSDNNNNNDSNNNNHINIDTHNDEPPMKLGGKVNQPSYALLTGQYEDPKDDDTPTTTKNIKKEAKLIKVPITTLPAILGRTQKTNNEHIFDLGNVKALSRKHVVIFYSDGYGGKLNKKSSKDSGGDGDNDNDDDDGGGGNENKSENNDNKNDIAMKEWSYQKPSKLMAQNEIIKNKDEQIPLTGFYAIECVSKNKIFVNKSRVEQGQIAILSHGSTIRMAGYCLYFLLPQEKEQSSSSTHIGTIKVLHPVENKEDDSDDDDSDDDDDDENNDNDNGGTAHVKKKQKRDSSSTTAPTTPGTTTSKATDPYENKPLSELLSEFIEAVDNDIFERKHSMMSSCIMYHAVQDVKKSRQLQKISKDENGMSRAQIMDWIGDRSVYKEWSVKILTQLEMKSYKSNLSKALLKAGFTRKGTTGRHVKWMFPQVKEGELLNDENYVGTDDNDDVDKNKNSTHSDNINDKEESFEKEVGEKADLPNSNEHPNETEGDNKDEE